MTLALVDLDQEQQQQDDMSVYTGKGGLAVLNKQGGLTLNSILAARATSANPYSSGVLTYLESAFQFYQSHFQ